LSPLRWNAERKTRNLANEIAIQRAAAEAVTTTYHNMQKQVSAQNATFKESTELKKQIRTITKALNERPLTTKERNFFIERRDHLQTALRALNSNTTAVYNTVPAAADPYSQRMPL
jgi:small-conductance mechanosensitive channel